MNKKIDIKIDMFAPGDEGEISKLVQQVYDKFVAPDYTENGNSFFYQFIKQEEILKRFNENTDAIFLAKIDQLLVGVLSIKKPNHISLLFVHKDYQGCGISKKLFNQFLSSINKNEIKEISVHSSPYSEKIYEKLGFIKESEMQETFGIKYIPMKMKLK